MAMRRRNAILSESTAKHIIVDRLAAATDCATKTLLFCATVDAADKFSETLQQRGPLAKAYHSKLSKSERSAILDDLANANLQAVVAVDALDEGVDVPDVDLGIIIAGTNQRRQMIQRKGRIVRKKHDGRNACFVVVYARDTMEDPANLQAGESHLDVIFEHAERVICGDDFSKQERAHFVHETIFGGKFS